MLLRAALLAAEGLTGPASMLEGERGFCSTFGDETNKMAALTAGLGSEWQILRAHYKNYAQDGYVQPMTEAQRAVTQVLERAALLRGQRGVARELRGKRGIEVAAAGNRCERLSGNTLDLKHVASHPEFLPGDEPGAGQESSSRQQIGRAHV